MFQSCADYHCEEILNSVDDIQKKVKDLTNAPVLYFAYILKTVLHYMDEELSLADYIEIVWDETLTDFQFRKCNTKDDKRDYSLMRKKDGQKILDLLQLMANRYNTVYTVENNKYRICFKSDDDYIRFSNEARKKAEGHFEFSGDVWDITSIYRRYEGIVELEKWDEYCITHTLAMILGVREITD